MTVRTVFYALLIFYAQFFDKFGRDWTFVEEIGHDRQLIEERGGSHSSW